jgi:capsular exopolysaccharide synthesis family protein
MTTTTVNSEPALVDAETYEPISKQVVTVSDPGSAAAEQYRILRHRIEAAARNGLRTLAFTSAQDGEGKTTTVVNAALALGLGGRNRVALVDADLRRPRVHYLLGLRPQQGLCDVVAGRATLSSALWRFGADQLYVLPAGHVPEDRSRVLYDPHFTEMIDELKEKFDFVLFDTTSVLTLADVPALCGRIDAAVLVVRAGVTPRELVAAALDAVSHVPIAGTVLNCVEEGVTPRLRRLEHPARRALPAATG